MASEMGWCVCVCVCVSPEEYKCTRQAHISLAVDSFREQIALLWCWLRGGRSGGKRMCLTVWTKPHRNCGHPHATFPFKAELGIERRGQVSFLVMGR